MCLFKGIVTLSSQFTNPPKSWMALVMEVHRYSKSNTLLNKSYPQGNTEKFWTIESIAHTSFKGCIIHYIKAFDLLLIEIITEYN